MCACVEFQQPLRSTSDRRFAHDVGHERIRGMFALGICEIATQDRVTGTSSLARGRRSVLVWCTPDLRGRDGGVVCFVNEPTLERCLALPCEPTVLGRR